MRIFLSFFAILSIIGHDDIQQIRRMVALVHYSGLNRSLRRPPDRHCLVKIVKKDRRQGSHIKDLMKLHLVFAIFA